MSSSAWRPPEPVREPKLTRAGRRPSATDWLLRPFQPISLKQLNAKAEMLERLDHKYVIRSAVLRQAVSELARHFDILEIKGKRAFTYDTCYFDDAQRRSYLDAQQGRRRRCKVRVRKYAEARLCFVEIKLKDRRGITVKKRLGYDADKYRTLDASARAHIRAAYGELYGRAFNNAHALEPVLEMRYRRITLVAKEGGERMTLDHGLEFFAADGQRRAIDEDVFIVETKSANGNGLADRILRRWHQHPTPHLSKYCVGMAALRQVPRYNRHLPALRKLNVIPQPHRCGPQPIAYRIAPEAGRRGARARVAQGLSALARHVQVLTAPASALLVGIAVFMLGGPLAATRGEAPRLVKQGEFTIPPATAGGVEIKELSGLAWDPDEQLLYAVSDRGKVFHFRLDLAGGAITVGAPVYAARLANPDAKGARSGRVNAEGLTVLNADNGKAGDTQLVVAAEGGAPRIIRFTPTGSRVGEIPVPAPLDNRDHYRDQARRGLEALAFHPEHGLITAPESPLSGQPENLHTVYARGRHWSFARFSPDSRLKALDVLSDGSLLVLERSGSAPALTASLRRLNLAACRVDGACAVDELAVLPAGPDNFEGMTRLGHRVLLASDNGGKDRPDTRLVLFALQ